MRLGILAPADSWHFLDLCRADLQQRHEFVSLAYSRLVAALPTGNVASQSQPLDDLDLLLTRAMPAGSLEQVVFRMDALQVATQRGLICVNSPKAVEVSVDKYLSLSRLAAAGLPVPPTLVCENHRDVGDAFEQLGEDVVLKPLFGSEGRGLVRVRERELAERYYRFVEGIGGVLYLQKFLDLGGQDLRVLVVGDDSFCMRRIADHGWRANVSQGGRGEPASPSADIVELARRAGQAVDAEFAGVDIGFDRDEKPYVLEVNAAPGWRAISRVLDIDIGQQLLHFLERRLQDRRESA